MKPFEWYGKGFLRITHAISRLQEFAADALAARTVGAAPLATGLRTIHGAAGAFVPYWYSEVVPVLGQGFRPPIAAGFTHFLAAAPIASQVTAAIEHEMRAGTSDPYDTHPPLRDRVAALGDQAAHATPDTGPRAITLLDRVDELEARLIAHLSDAKHAESLAAIPWSEAGPQVWTAIWRDRVRSAAEHLAGITPAQIPAIVADTPGAAVRFGFVPNREVVEQRGDGISDVLQLLGSGLATGLLERGWTVRALPGESVVFSRGSESVTPFNDIGRLMRGELAATEWEATWRKLGLLDVDLGRPGGGVGQALPTAAQDRTVRA
jgi:hypothetical protein